MAAHAAVNLWRPVSPLSLAFFRVCFGLILALDCWHFLRDGWIPLYWSADTFHFTFYGFDWVRPWPGNGMTWHVVLLGLCALGLMLGICYRLSAALFFLGFSYLFLLEQTRYLNHFYLVVLLALLWIFLPGNAAFCRGRWRQPRSVPYLAIGLLRVQVGLVYTFAGIAKLNADWLQARPLVDWLGGRSDLPGIGLVLAQPWAPWLFSYGGLVIDLVAFPLLCWRSTRAWMFSLLLAFHLLNAWVFGIGIFPWLMIAATTIFFEPDWPRVLWQGVPTTFKAGARRAAGVQRGWLTVAAIYIIIQVFVPLRHFLYPGSVHWTEEGHRFAWHMKLRGKRAEAVFLVEDEANDRHWLVDPVTELGSTRAGKMSGRPDMILQYAHHLADSYSADQGVPIAVYAHVQASLNGHPVRTLIDPTVDLAKQARNLWPAPWIVH